MQRRNKLIVGIRHSVEVEREAPEISLHSQCVGVLLARLLGGHCAASFQFLNSQLSKSDTTIREVYHESLAEGVNQTVLNLGKTRFLFECV